MRCGVAVPVALPIVSYTPLKIAGNYPSWLQQCDVFATASRPCRGQHFVLVSIYLLFLKKKEVPKAMLIGI